jgi:protein-tyrosine phosphatase
MQTVLFVCTGNYYRSRYAEMLFNATKPASLHWIAISRGFDPSPVNPGPIAQVVIERLRERGYPAPNPLPSPRRLKEADLHNARRIIALDADEHPAYVEEHFPAWRGKFEFWRVPDLDRMSASEALGLIEANVEWLIDELNAEQ